MKKIVLASGSPRRKHLLRTLGLKFETKVSKIDEILNPRLKPENQPAYLSRIKALEVSSKEENALVIGADSMVLVGDKIMGKPKDSKDAKRMLRILSGTEHFIITGFTIIDAQTKKSITKSISTKVKFRKISEKEIDNYIKLDKPFDKAGAYAIQGVASIFVEKIEGDYFGALGLSLHQISKELKKFGVEVL